MVNAGKTAQAKNGRLNQTAIAIVKSKDMTTLEYNNKNKRPAQAPT